MAEDVIESMGSLKLTSEEEEDIQVSDEGRLEGIDSCVLSLIGKFLTCKPFNRRAAKNTLRRAWGLDKELQIAEVGNNLFQFKFKSEYELERILRGGPWTFDNQLLMLTRWRTGMSANNVVLEHASLWVQIWGVPFDMMSPSVAREVGNKMGTVEDVERRRRMDEQNFFLRVRVALPISKPLRRGGFLLGSDGKRHWVTYKYERMPMFCHYCGILGHDIRHCPAHFLALKTEKAIDYQYGDWLKADGGRRKSPPRRSQDSTPRAASMENFDDQDKERSKAPAAATTLTGAQTSLERRKSQNGSLGIGGHGPDIQERISGENETQNSKKDSPVTLSPLCEDLFPNLTTISNGGPSTANLVVGQTDLKPTKPKGTWTRMARMDVGPLDKSQFYKL
ncbi:uncharacterized protein CFP56_039359 [Quercus suber]|uniref:CCHC-type domain-containing protein n=1 Tax=Quercus suber TaxID=58331 RepID=A0AAW0LN32_QUESU